MRKLASEHTKGIFRQLGGVEGATGVKTIIENHDAWVHNAQVQDQITQAMRMQTMHKPRMAGVSERIARNRAALSGLVQRLPMRVGTAG
jgi:hypothetical protein